MLSSKYRLTKNGSFSYVYAHGARYNGGLIRLNFVPAKSGVRIGFSVSNKIGHAVVRNLVKRRMRAAAAEYLPSIKPCQAVFIAALGVHELDYAEIKRVMGQLLENAGLIKP